MSPERFEIVVRGTLGPEVLTAIDGFDASYCTDGHTHLVGLVPDQARIHGLFQRLLDLNIELVSVNPVREDGTGQDQVHLDSGAIDDHTGTPDREPARSALPPGQTSPSPRYPSDERKSP